MHTVCTSKYYAVPGQAEGPFWNPKEGWKAVEGCLHARDKLLLLFENAEDTQGTPQGRQVGESPTCMGHLPYALLHACIGRAAQA